MTALMDLSPFLLEYGVFEFLDPKSLLQVSQVNHRLRGEIDQSSHWATHVAKQFGITLKAFVTKGLSTPPLLFSTSSATKTVDTASTIRWKEIFHAAAVDRLKLKEAKEEKDVLDVCSRSPDGVSLQASESHIREEIVLMQGLRQFPTSDFLIIKYAEMIRGIAV